MPLTLCTLHLDTELVWRVVGACSTGLWRPPAKKNKKIKRRLKCCNRNKKPLMSHYLKCSTSFAHIWEPEIRVCTLRSACVVWVLSLSHSQTPQSAARPRRLKCSRHRSWDSLHWGRLICTAAVIYTTVCVRCGNYISTEQTFYTSFRLQTRSILTTYFKYKHFVNFTTFVQFPQGTRNL